MSSISDAIDLNGQEGSMMTGVFRWKKSHHLRSLPASSTGSSDFTKGWMELFQSRCKSKKELENLVEYVQQDLSIIDCLSFPATIVSAIKRSNLLSENQSQSQQVEILDELHIVCMGCSSKTEERILRETRCWHELGIALQGSVHHVHLYLVGPELSCTENNVLPFHRPLLSDIEMSWSALELAHLTAHTHKGTASDFFKSHKHLIPLPSMVAGLSQRSVNTIAVGLNCGFGNFDNPGPSRYDLLISWYGDLAFLCSLQCLPMIFTCANDYADLTGEVMLHSNYFGSIFLCNPNQNPFCCASTFVAEGHNSTEDFSCGNIYWYAVQGSDSRRKCKFADGAYKLPISLATPVSERFSFMHALLGQRETLKAALARLEVCKIGSTERNCLPIWKILSNAKCHSGSLKSEPKALAPSVHAVHDDVEKQPDSCSKLDQVPTTAPTIQQHLEDGKTLRIICDFSSMTRSAGFVLQNVEALVDTAGEILMIRCGDMSTPVSHVTLLNRVSPSSVKAKMSTKLMRLTITAHAAN